MNLMDLKKFWTWKNVSAPTKRRRPRKSVVRASIDALEDRRLLSATRFVDATFPTTDTSHFTTIQAAVDAANAGDTVQIAAGVYNESVTVTKTLNLLGAQTANAQTRLRDAAHETIVDPVGGAGFTLTANDILLQGFTIADNHGGITSLSNSNGITTSRNFSGYQIYDNYIEQNSLGIYLSSEGGHPTIVERNVFSANNENKGAINPPLGPAAAHSGMAIFSDLGLSNATIDGNYFTGQFAAAVKMVGGGTSPNGPGSLQIGVGITNNQIVNDAPIFAVNTTTSAIDRNTLSGPGAAIIFAGGVNRTEVVGNNLQNGAYTAIELASAPSVYPVAVANFSNHVSSNFIYNFGVAGIDLQGQANGNLIEGNTINTIRPAPAGTSPAAGYGNGISLEGAPFNTIRGNTVQSLPGYGIALLEGNNPYYPGGVAFAVCYNCTVTGNTAQNAGLNGIVVVSGTLNTVSNNTALDNTLDGMRLIRANSNTLTANTAVNNSRDGYRVEPDSFLNTINSNFASGNGDQDYHDDSSGSVTANTANFYDIHNVGVTQNRTGLALSATVKANVV